MHSLAMGLALRVAQMPPWLQSALYGSPAAAQRAYQAAMAALRGGDWTDEAANLADDIPAVSKDCSALLGQLHHGIGARIHSALEKSSLQGQFTLRDPRFTTRAVDNAAHNGYQTWHRVVDESVRRDVLSGWYDDAAHFADDLEELYGGVPGLVGRFPQGMPSPFKIRRP